MLSRYTVLNTIHIQFMKYKVNNMTPDKQEVAKRVKLAEEMAKEVSQIKPIADVAKDLADHVDEIVLAKMIETAKNK
jgi:hypothetical protein